VGDLADNYPEMRDLADKQPESWGIWQITNPKPQQAVGLVGDLADNYPEMRPKLLQEVQVLISQVTPPPTPLGQRPPPL
jgi:hypothetical protein